MRTLIDIPDRDLSALDRLAKNKGVSRAALVRQVLHE
jgi:hypothetical protein